MRKKVLAIVAHPDDETIWMGGVILKNKDWNWIIFSLCRAEDSDRAPRFKKVCEFYGAKAIISNLEDEELAPLKVEFIIKKIKENLKEKEFDYIFTHGENGEYGHLRHKEIHNAVRKMIQVRELKCKGVYYFSYVPGRIDAPHNPELKIPVPDESANNIINLTEKEFEKKLKLITDYYGFKHPIFETLSCNKKEAFVLK